MNGIFVHPSYQNLGIGSKALKFVEAIYKDALVWTLWTPHKTYKNHHFYEKAGFKRTGQEEVINEYLTLIQYRKHMAYLKKGIH